MTVSPLRILSMEVDVDDNDDSFYRVVVDSRVRYLTVKLGTISYHDLASRHTSFLETLRPFPDGKWSSMIIKRGTDGELETQTSEAPLSAVEPIWHTTSVDVLALEQLDRLGPRTHVVCYQQGTAITKIARFEWEIPYLESETRAYHQLIGTRVTPRFLAHLTEHDRVMGVLLERVEGRCAGLDDIETCRQLLKKGHANGLVHGDANKFNFVIGKQRSWILDFENASPYDAALAGQELTGLKAQLEEESGRGGPPVADEESEL